MYRTIEMLIMRWQTPVEAGSREEKKEKLLFSPEAQDPLANRFKHKPYRSAPEQFRTDPSAVGSRLWATKASHLDV